MDVTRLGFATWLISVEAVAQQLGVTRAEAREWLKTLGLDPIIVAHREMYHLVYLELALWWLSRPRAFREHLEQHPRPDEAVLRAFYRELQSGGRVYSGVARNVVRRRVERLLTPHAKTVRAGKR